MRMKWVRAVAAGVVAACGLAASASGQLTQAQVLVVYDSRVPDSLAVAEYYAGSAKVPGGTGGQAGSRPGVRVVNLATLAGAGVVPAVPDISYTQFINQVRDPLRSYLVSSNLAESVRCIVLTKGIPHRVQDISVANLGDDPGSAGNAFVGRELTYCSVDSELTLLHQNLSTGTGSQIGTQAAGLMRNPYFRVSQPIGRYPTRFNRTAKPFIDAVGFGPGVVLGGFELADPVAAADARRHLHGVPARWQQRRGCEGVDRPGQGAGVQHRDGGDRPRRGGVERDRRHRAELRAG